MKPTWTRLAKSVTAKPLNLRHASASLLPPVPYVRFQVVTSMVSPRAERLALANNAGYTGQC